MSFRNRDLSVIAYANGFTLWHYSSTDAPEVILADGYFDTVVSLMNTGDIIIVCTDKETALKRINIDPETRVIRLEPLK